MAPEERATSIDRRSIEIRQPLDRRVYLFALGANEILQIADVSRVGRGESGDLIGYQRPEVRRHVQEIVDYLAGEDVIFPNAIILALSPEVRFRKSRGPSVDDGFAQAGTLEIPVPSPGARKPAWIVDGQQRALALSESGRTDLAIPVAGFIGDTIGLQRDQFIRINNTRALPASLVTELLPEVSTVLPARLAARRLPSALTDLLNRETASPFHNIIRRASTPPGRRKETVVTDTSLIKAIEESLNQPAGLLFTYRNIATNEVDTDRIWATLLRYWSSVKEVFPDAWGLPARKSRLMHGVGIRSMGRMMDRIMEGIDPLSPDAQDVAVSRLEPMREACHWVSGSWDELGLAWNELQNTPAHINLLSNYLIRKYLLDMRPGL